MKNYTKSKPAFFSTLGFGLAVVINSHPVYAAATGSNLTITPVFDSSITSLSNSAEYVSAINTQIGIIESYITTNSLVNLKINFKSVTSGLGSSVVSTTDIDYTTYRDSLNALPNKTQQQITAFNSLPTGSNAGFNNNASQVSVTAAQLLALGDTTNANSLLNGDNGLAGTIKLNTSKMFPSRTNIDPTKYDFESTVAHEILEVLGSGGWGSTLYGSTLASDIGPLDLYRYSAPGVRSFTLDSTATSYFSIDGGITNISYFNQDNNGDYADWADSSTAAVQDAFGYKGEITDIGAKELIALNAIGYGLTSAGIDLANNTPAAVPLPSATWLMLSGLIGFHGLRKRKLAA